MSFPDLVRQQALISSGRHCCLCHRFRGIKLELHHIVLKSEGGTDTFDNCIPLCFDCHADMRSYDSKHPVGTKYSRSELRLHRDNWYEKMAGTSVPNPSTEAIPADVVTYRGIIEAFPWNGPMKWLKETDLGGSMLRGSFSAFNSFLDASDDPTKEFFDADLESLRATFVSGLEESMELISTNIFLVEGKDDVMRIAAGWRYRDEERFRRLMKRIHSSVDLVVQAYRDLIRGAELRLRGNMVGS